MNWGHAKVLPPEEEGRGAGKLMGGNDLGLWGAENPRGGHKLCLLILGLMSLEFDMDICTQACAL